MPEIYSVNCCRTLVHWTAVCLNLFWVGICGAANVRYGWNFDTGLPARNARELLVDQAPGRPPEGSWLRIRGLESWGRASPALIADDRERLRRIEDARADLGALRSQGYRLVVFMRWATESWKGGVRAGVKSDRLPRDLREPFERSRELARAYGDLVDYWEIDNEPDISFVKENAEIYTAFLKACYLGIRLGKSEFQPPNTKFRPETIAPGVLMAPLALPPGPYFEALAANDGLRYTDAFNYHYYGYAEDFSGAYRQFQAACADVSRTRADESLGPDAIFRTQFYPNATAWSNTATASFDHSEERTKDRRMKAMTRALALEEPAARQVGRWLVSAGVEVEEINGSWRFTVRARPPGSFRAPYVELPLPAEWRLEPETLVTFEYRTAVLKKTNAATVGPAVSATAEKKYTQFEPRRVAMARYGDDIQAVVIAPKGNRELPIFITECGYGSLDKSTRQTLEGRIRQQRWFRSVGEQIQRLGIEGAFNFLLVPYLEFDLEFGLLMDSSSAPEPNANQPWPKWGPYTVSPALSELLANGTKPLNPRRWAIHTPPPNQVVIDFLGGAGLSMAKSYNGYFLEGQNGLTVPGGGTIIAYNFGESDATGTIQLEGDAWSLIGGTRSAEVRLTPHERKEIPVHIWPKVNRFIACPVAARFVAGPIGPQERRAVLPKQEPQAASPMPVPRPAEQAPSSPIMHAEMFECYFRTENDNLYQTWPRLAAVSTWQRYMERVENFTPAFYGRHKLPWRFMDNKPVSLVFFFHPEQFPTVFEVRGAQLVKFHRPMPE